MLKTKCELDASKYGIQTTGPWQSYIKLKVEDFKMYNNKRADVTYSLPLGLGLHKKC